MYRAGLPHRSRGLRRWSRGDIDGKDTWIPSKPSVRPSSLVRISGEPSVSFFPLPRTSLSSLPPSLNRFSRAVFRRLYGARQHGRARARRAPLPAVRRPGMAVHEARHGRDKLLRVPLPTGPPQPGQTQGAARIRPHAPPEARPSSCLPSEATRSATEEAAEETGSPGGGADRGGVEAADGEEGEEEGGGRGADRGDKGPP